MDIEKAKELSDLATKQIENARLYRESREKSGIAKSQLYILLTAKLKELRGNKKNLGVEMAVLMLMEESHVAKDLYKEWTEQESRYKSLEKIIEAYASKISLEQSIMKYLRHGEDFGA